MADCHNPDANTHRTPHGKIGTSAAKALADSSTATRIALIGSPNAGKTSVFNKLTGLNSKTGNYPGITVSHTEGHVTPTVILEDLPAPTPSTPSAPTKKSSPTSSPANWTASPCSASSATARKDSRNSAPS